MAVTYPGNAELDGLALGNRGDDTNPYLVVGTTSLNLPSKRVNRYTVSGTHGVFQQPVDYFGSRSVTLALLVRGADSTATMSAVRTLVEKAAIYQEDVEQYLDIWLPGESEAWRFTGRVIDVKTTAANTQHSAMQCAVRFDTNLASAITPTATTTTLTFQPSVSGGWEYPKTFPYTYGSGAGASVNIVNSGNFPYEPVMRIYGPCTDPVITSAVNNQRIEFTGLTVLSGDHIEINTRNGTVLLNGTANRYSYLDLTTTTFIKLFPGSNLISWTPNTGTGSYLEIDWRSARM